MIPDQIPYRQVDHDFGYDGAGELSLPVGDAKHTVDWMTKEALEEWEIDMERREAARKKLGGFGLGTHRL